MVSSFDRIAVNRIYCHFWMESYCWFESVLVSFGSFCALKHTNKRIQGLQADTAVPEQPKDESICYLSMFWRTLGRHWSRMYGSSDWPRFWTTTKCRNGRDKGGIVVETETWTETVLVLYRWWTIVCRRQVLYCIVQSKTGYCTLLWFNLCCRHSRGNVLDPCTPS